MFVIIVKTRKKGEKSIEIVLPESLHMTALCELEKNYVKKNAKEE